MTEIATACRSFPSVYMDRMKGISVLYLHHEGEPDIPATCSTAHRNLGHVNLLIQPV